MKTALGLLFLALPFAAAADTVIPVESVDSFVNIRGAPEAGAEVVGRLQKDAPRVLVESMPGWHEVELDDGSSGFVSADWSVVVADDADADPDKAGADSELAAAEPAPDMDSEDSSVADEPGADIAVAEAAAEETPPTETAAADSTAGVVDETAAERVDEASAGSVVEAAAPEPGQAEADAEPPGADADVAQTEVATTVVPVSVAGQSGPQGPVGPPGPPGPPGEGSVKGTENFLVKFRRPTVGGDSQIYDDGNFVGVGTTEPKQRLEVNGSIQVHDQHSGVAGLMITQSTGDTGYILHNRASTLTIGSGSVDRITIDRDGNVGVGMSRPMHPLEMANGAYVSSGGVWTNSSSRERKENIETLTVEDALAALAELEPVQFNYLADSSETYVGFIAEDVPSLVANNDRQSLSTMDIVAVLTKVIQQQQARIEQLEERIGEQRLNHDR